MATVQAADESLIIGVREHRKWGPQACAETANEDGWVVRRLETASDGGLLECSAMRLSRITRTWNLADDQSIWSDRDRGDFEDLLLVTELQIQLKNVATSKKDRPTDYCVELHKKVIYILTITSLKKLVGLASARAKMEKVFKRNGIPTP